MGLLERDSYLQSLNAWLDGVASGVGCIVLMSGEAGIGKTSLLQQFAPVQRKAQGLPIRILWGGCEALFTPHPLAPLYDIARQAGGEFTQEIYMATKRDVVFNITMDHLARGPVPTILIFEDVHWADEATLDLIKYLGRRLQRLGVMMIISYRDDEVGAKHPLQSVIGDLPAAFVHRLQLASLSAAAVATLADAVGRPAEGLHEITAGNPFFVTEALAVPEGNVPATVRDAVIARLARLSEPARAIVNLAALVPGKTERWLLDKATPKAGAAIQECLSVGMIALADGSLAFRHELARRAVEEHLPVPQRQDLHARILQTLLRHIGSEIPTTRLVHHADHAGDSALVLRFAPLAAERAASLSAHREAAAHYETALRHATAWEDACRADLLERLSYECYLTEQVDEAIVAREAALKLWRATGNRLKIGDSLRWLSRLSWFNGLRLVAEQYATEAIDVLEALPQGRELAFAYSNRAQLHMLANEAEPALDWGQKAIDLASAMGDTEILSHAFNNVGTAKAIRLDAQGRVDLERSLKLALEGGFQEHAARAYTNLATNAIRVRDFDFANQSLKEGIAYCEEHGLDSWSRYMTASRAVTYLAPVTKIQALVVLGLVRARRGDPDADTPLDEALQLARPTGEIQRIGPVTAARAEAAWLQGRLPEVSPEICATYALARTQSDPWMQGELAFWSWRCGAPVGDMDGVAGPFALQIAGKWREAAETWKALGCTYEQAMALADSDEENSLRLALEILERQGAAPLAGIVRRKLRAGGIRGISRGVQERTRQNPQGLTTRELGVLALLMQGSRNADIARRLFVSEKTVDHHVSSILGKLGVRSRGEAAAAAHRLGLADSVNGEHAAKK